MKRGLVLEGGGLRCLFSEGVFDVMLEGGIEFDGMIGVSAGASIGCNFKSRQIGRALRYNQRYAGDKRYISMRSLLTTGDIVNKDFAYHKLPMELDRMDVEAYESNPMEFYAVCTDADTGNAEARRLDKLDYESLEWMRASSSMPIVSKPVEIGGRRFLDGGISDSIPLMRFKDLGYGRNVVVLTQPKGYFKKRTRLMPLFRLLCGSAPAIVQAMARRHEMYNAQLRYVRKEEIAGNALIICPERPLEIGRLEMNSNKMRKVYDLGRKAGESSIGRIRDFLNL